MRSSFSAIKQLLLVLALSLAASTLFCAQPDNAQAQALERNTALERQVKAAYLYKFASFVEWPEGTFTHADNPLIIGVIGADELADELEKAVAGHTANGRAINIRKLHRGDALDGVNVLFIGQQDKKQVQDILAACKGNPILTVTESAEAYALGSMINFVVTEEKLRFEVALKPVGMGRLKISARMLAAAYKVAPAPSS